MGAAGGASTPAAVTSLVALLRSRLGAPSLSDLNALPADAVLGARVYNDDLCHVSWHPWRRARRSVHPSLPPIANPADGRPRVWGGRA